MRIIYQNEDDMKNMAKVSTNISLDPELKEKEAMKDKKKYKRYDSFEKIIK